jgi:hypothetical protein
LLNDKGVIDEIKEKIKSNWKLKKMKTLPIWTYGTQKGGPERKAYSHECNVKRSERSNINDLMLHLKLLEK